MAVVARDIDFFASEPARQCRIGDPLGSGARRNVAYLSVNPCILHTMELSIRPYPCI